MLTNKNWNCSMSRVLDVVGGFLSMVVYLISFLVYIFIIRKNLVKSAKEFWHLMKADN